MPSILDIIRGLTGQQGSQYQPWNEQLPVPGLTDTTMDPAAGEADNSIPPPMLGGAANGPQSQPPNPMQQGGWRGRIGGMLDSALAAGATPNIAGGGPTDIMRAMQAGVQSGRDRSLLGYQIGRQRNLDELAKRKQEAEIGLEQAHQKAYEEQAARERNRYIKDAKTGRIFDTREQKYVEDTAPKTRTQQLQEAAALVPTIKASFPGATDEEAMHYALEGKLPMAPRAAAEKPLTYEQYLTGVLAEPKSPPEAKAQAEQKLVEMKKYAQPAEKPIGLSPEIHSALIANNAKNPLSPTADEMKQARKTVEDEKAAVARASRPLREMDPARADKAAAARAIRQAYIQSGGDWREVARRARSMEFGDYSSDVADHADKMAKLPADSERKVTSSNAVVDNVSMAVKALKEFTKEHPDLVGSGFTNPVAGVKRWVETKAGTEPADIGLVDQALETASALQPGQHNFRNMQALAEFKKQLGIDPRTGKADGSRAWLINPDKAVSALEGVSKFNENLRDNLINPDKRQSIGQRNAAGGGGPVQGKAYPPHVEKMIADGIAKGLAKNRQEAIAALKQRNVIQ